MEKGPIFAFIGMLVCAVGIGGYYGHQHSKVIEAPRIGVVRLQDVVERHPNFHSYDEQKKNCCG